MGKLARMNQSKKIEDDGKLVRFDFSAAAVAVMKEQLVRDVVSNTIVQIVQKKHPEMDRIDGPIWGAWQEVLLAEPEGAVDITRKQVKWLRDIFAQRDFKTTFTLAQSREAILDYLEELLAEAPEPEKRDA